MTSWMNGHGNDEGGLNGFHLNGHVNGHTDGSVDGIVVETTDAAEAHHAAQDVDVDVEPVPAASTTHDQDEESRNADLSDAATEPLTPRNEREDLERELAATHDAIAAARSRVAEREAAVKAALREELMASRERLAEMDRDHDVRITAIRAEAEAAIALIMRDETESQEDAS